MLRFILFVLFALPMGCATRSAYSGYPATDLSWLKPGFPRTELDALLGAPDSMELESGGSVAHYVYDRGFVGGIEETSTAEKIAWAPIMAWGEFVSLGLVGWMAACQKPCQKGLLTVHFDEGNHVTDVSEAFLPDEHPVVSGCIQTAVRGDYAVCMGTRERIRPATLDSQSWPSESASVVSPR